MKTIRIIIVICAAAWIAGITWLGCANDDDADSRLYPAIGDDDEQDDDTNDDANDDNEVGEIYPCPEGMTFIPGGCTDVVSYGERWDGFYHETACIDPFCIDKYEASQPDATEDIQGSWLIGVAPGPAQSVPGVLPWSEIGFDNAAAACESAGKRLPSLAEWQTAFSGWDGALWPWGDEWQDNDCYVDMEAGVNPTGGCCECVKYGNACFVVCDMVGNVSEWIDGYWDESCYDDEQVLVAGGAAHISHTIFNSQSIDSENLECWKFSSYSHRRCGLHHHNRMDGFNDDGFRCVMDIPS